MNNLPLTDWSRWKLIGLVLTLQAISFLSGLYSGHTYWPKQIPQVMQLNYNTELTPVATTKIEGANQQTEDCLIKGNISGKSKIYHVQGGAFYDRTQEEMCFKTEAEAVTAGFTKSSR